MNVCVCKQTLPVHKSQMRIKIELNKYEAVNYMSCVSIKEKFVCLI